MHTIVITCSTSLYSLLDIYLQYANAFVSILFIHILPVNLAYTKYFYFFQSGKQVPHRLWILLVCYDYPNAWVLSKLSINLLGEVHKGVEKIPNILHIIGQLRPYNSINVGSRLHVLLIAPHQWYYLHFSLRVVPNMLVPVSIHSQYVDELGQVRQVDNPRSVQCGNQA